MIVPCNPTADDAVGIFYSLPPTEGLSKNTLKGSIMPFVVKLEIYMTALFSASIKCQRCGDVIKKERR